MRCAVGRVEVIERETVAAELVVGAPAQVERIRTRISRDGGILDEEGEVGDGVLLVTALNHGGRVVKDAAELVALLELCADLRLLRAACLFVACEELVVLALQLVAFLLEACQLCLVLGEGSEIDL